MQRDMRLLSPRVPSILVATPGRLLEHLDKTRVDRRKFCDIVEETKIVVLDEADRLFESFPQETKKILSFLPRAEKRQTLLFSATIPKKLRYFLKNTMKIDDDGSAKSETNLRAEQLFCRLQTMDAYISKLVQIIQHEMKEDENFKIIVFCE
jgi:ATP-dependent RNA helicase MSS116